MSARSDAIRPATLGDAHALAELANMAGEGLPLYVWTKMVQPGEDPWAIGRARAEREEGSFSYRNAAVIESDGHVVACLIGYPIPDTPKAIDKGAMPAMFVPLQELENLAPGTWYVNVLATSPKWRGKGVGTALLKNAEKRAAAAGVQGLSVIVADNNTGARRLYERSGYREIADRPMVKEDWPGLGSRWVLLAKR